MELAKLEIYDCKHPRLQVCFLAMPNMADILEMHNSSKISDLRYCVKLKKSPTLH